MRASTHATAVACAVLVLASCSETGSGLDNRREMNTWASQTARRNAVENAIVAQRTLYPYHFVPGASTLNELGRSDLAVLASHLRTADGKVVIRRADTPKDLYESRVEEVRKFLIQAKVDASAVPIDDGFPGGDGSAAIRVVEVLSGDDKEGEAGAGSPAAPAGMRTEGGR